jgi:hypothetical protein
MQALRRFARDHALSTVLLGFFLVLLLAESVAGHRSYNADQRDHGEPVVGYAEYVTTGHFGETVFENWESEFLQMGVYVLFTVWLRERGSPESKGTGEEDVDEPPEGHAGDPAAPWPVRRGGLALKLYKNSLSLAFLLLFLLSWLGHAVTGAHEYSSEQESHGGEPVTTAAYVRTSQFWNESLQNWQSEFLAVGALVVLSVYLRQQGSPESKPVAAPHHPPE